jgi:RNA polymerase sigma factor (sigma-70 family)
MRDVLEKLLRTADVPTPERAQQRWEEYRHGVDSSDPRARATADAAFAMLLAWYGATLYRRVWGFIRSEAADDVFQNVLRKLHVKRLSPRLNSFHANVLPWLRTVTIRQCVDAQRSAARRRQREASFAHSRDLVFSRDSHSELEEVLVVALAQLPNKLQEAIALHFFEGLEIQEAASELGVHRDTLSARLKAALVRLRKQLTTSVGIALGAELSITAALSSPPRMPSAVRLSELAAGAWAQATSGWTMRQAILLLSTGLILMGGAATMAAWTTRGRQPTATDLPPEKLGAVRLRSESLQEKNLRLLHSEVIPLLLKESRTFTPADNPLRLADVRAFGSEVECQFQTEQPIIAGWKPAGIKLRYCTLMRKLEIAANLDGNSPWKVIDPERPIILDLAIPGVPVPAVNLATKYVTAAQAAFDRLPSDVRAEAEQLQRLFGASPMELLLPAGMSGFAADAGQLFAVDARTHALFIRDLAGRWHYGGNCPGWWLAVHGGQLYCIRGDEILTRSVDAPTAPWARWSDLPLPGKNEGRGFLAVNGERIYVAIHPNIFSHRPIAKPEQPWKREVSPIPIWPNGISATVDRFFGHDATHVIARPLQDSAAPWSKVARWPKECQFLVIDGDRLLAFGGPGPIYTRPVAAGPEVDWSIVGRVHEPPRE